MSKLRELPRHNAGYRDYADFIAAYCIFCQYQTIVETGVYIGETTLKLCEVAKTMGGKVYGYDRFEPIGELLDWNNPSFGKEGVEKKLINAGFTDKFFKITKVDTKSPEFNNILRNDLNHIDFAFIDGDHSYSGIKNDYDIIYPLLIDDGSIMFHDTYNHPGCRKFVLDLQNELNDGKFEIINLPFGFDQDRCGLTILTKRSFPLYRNGLSRPNDDDIPLITEEEVYNAEQVWYNKQIHK